ncbi:MAG: hypothetical protein Q4C53_04020 [Clostridia bacterium]|nr:hypothetical protein [Clostridia bacterium]
MRKFPSMAVKVVLPLSTLLIFGYFCGNNMAPRAPLEWMGWTYKGNLRAFAEMGIGICMYDPVQKLRTVEFSKLGKRLLTVAEHGLYLAVIFYMYRYGADRKDYFILILFVAAVALSFAERGADTALFRHPMFAKLAQFSMPLFVSHSFWAGGLRAVLPASMTKGTMIGVYLVCSVVTTFFVMGVSAFIRNRMPQWKRAAKRLFLA